VIVTQWETVESHHVVDECVRRTVLSTVRAGEYEVRLARVRANHTHIREHFFSCAQTALGYNGYWYTNDDHVVANLSICPDRQPGGMCFLACILLKLVSCPPRVLEIGA
jgi:hypothetical protein